MNQLKTLPIGDSSFESIRMNNCLYVDKTKHIYKLIKKGKYYFLSRPRRFGKSLTISTLKALFEGKKELFDGLWISNSLNWDWKEYPIIGLDFNEITCDTPENLKVNLSKRLENIAQLYNIELKKTFLKEQFKELIQLLYQKNGTQVVVLIDEYDKPIIDFLGKGQDLLDIARKNRDILKDFFGVTKGMDVSNLLRFVFITGVSRFSRVSIFSELNNLKDITMNEDYSDMLGYTQEELESNFFSYLSEFAKKRNEPIINLLSKLKQQYNGYRFSSRDIKVYNPFSILNSMDEYNFKNFWFETGTPTFLVNLLNKSNWYLPTIENMQSTESEFSAYEIEKLQPEALLFQTGYITIKSIIGRLYTFDYPNLEVKTSFLEILFKSFMKDKRKTSHFVLLADYLQEGKIDSFIETLEAIFASIPYQLETKRDEAYYHTLFYLMVCASGINATSEVSDCTGRIDLVMKFADKIYIIEFKCNQSADNALEQIRKKGYDRQFKHTEKKIIKMGINFDTDKRNIGEWKIEE